MQEGSRACHICGAEVEDEEHFLMACPLYDELRASLFNEVTSQWQGDTQQVRQLRQRWAAGTQAQRFNLIMATQGEEEFRALGRYLERAWALRSMCLEPLPEDDELVLEP